MSNRIVKSELAAIGMTQRQLIYEMAMRGCVTTEAELSNILAGRRTGPKSERVKQLVEDIIAEWRNA